MGIGNHGGMGNTAGSKKPAAINLQNLKLRLAATPRETSIDFYNRLGKGGETVPLPNGKGTMIKLPKGCAGM